MDVIAICKALSNETRLNILEWLKDPEKNFSPQGIHLSEKVDLHGGVCVSSIRDKSGVSQSTISGYLDTLQRCGLLTSERCERWTYYRRNEETIQEFADFIANKL